jgi:hypothetical protein
MDGLYRVNLTLPEFVKAIVYSGNTLYVKDRNNVTTEYVISGNTLQSAYDGSTSPVIITDDERGPFIIKDGTGIDSSHLIEGINSIDTTTFFVRADGRVKVANAVNDDEAVTLGQLSGFTISGVTVEERSFETVSKNVKAYPYTMNRIGDTLENIVYDLGGGKTITKTFNRTGEKLTTIVLSGDTPSGIHLTKQFNYTGDILTSITYL